MKNTLQTLLLLITLVSTTSLFAQNKEVAFLDKIDVSFKKMEFKVMKDKRCLEVLFDKEKKIFYEPYMLKDKYKKAGKTLYIKYEYLRGKLPICPYAIPVMITEVKTKQPKLKK